MSRDSSVTKIVIGTCTKARVINLKRFYGVIFLNTEHALFLGTHNLTHAKFCSVLYLDLYSYLEFVKFSLC